MAGPYSPAVKNTALLTRIALVDFANPGSFKASPTIASGDFKVDIDGAGFNNLGTLPSTSPAAGVAVLLTLSASEMNGDVITITCIDQTSPKEWADQVIVFLTEAGSAYARLGAPAGASVSADIAAAKADTAAIKTKTDFLPSATAGAAGGVFIAGTNAATTVTTSFTTTFTGNLTGSVASVTGAVGSVTGAVGSVAAGGIASTSFAAGAIDAAAIATDAIGSAEVAASAVTKIQAGLSTYAGGDTAGTTTLLSRLTAGRATNLDNLDAAVSTRSVYAGGAVASVTAAVTVAAAGLNAVLVAGVALPTALGQMASTVAGTLSGAGTATEVFVFGTVTATATVDASGNRSAVVFS